MESGPTNFLAEPVKVYVSSRLARTLDLGSLKRVLNGDNLALMDAFWWLASQLSYVWCDLYIKRSIDVPYKHHLICYHFAGKKELLQGVRFEMSRAVMELINQS